MFFDAALRDKSSKSSNAEHRPASVVVVALLMVAHCEN